MKANKIAGLIGFSLLAVSCLGTTLLSNQKPASAAPVTVIGLAGKCLDADANQGGVNGNGIQIWDCTNEANQRWIFDGRLIKSAAYPNMCLDVDSNRDGENGSRVQLWDCTNGANQRWISDGRLIKSVAYPNMCLDADSNRDGANGSRVQLWDCTNGANQRWKK